MFELTYNSPLSPDEERDIEGSVRAGEEKSRTSREHHYLGKCKYFLIFTLI